MSYSMDTPFVLTKDPINLDDERKFRSFHGGLSPDEYIDKYHLKLPYPVRNCTPEIKAALAHQGFEAYDPYALRLRIFQESNRSEQFELRDMEEAVATLAAKSSRASIESSPALVGDERKVVNDARPARAKVLGKVKQTVNFEGRKPEIFCNWKGINARLQHLIDQQMDFNSSRADAGSCRINDATVGGGSEESNRAIRSFLRPGGLHRAKNPILGFDGPKPETVQDWGGVHKKLQAVVGQQMVFNSE